MWVDEELEDDEAALHACGGSGRLSYDGIKVTDCRVDVW